MIKDKPIQEQIFIDICLLGGKFVHFRNGSYFEHLPKRYKKKWRKMEKALVDFINEVQYHQFI